MNIWHTIIVVYVTVFCCRFKHSYTQSYTAEELRRINELGPVGRFFVTIIASTIWPIHLIWCFFTGH